MRQSELFTKTLKEFPKDEVSVNARFLEKAGFVYKNSAGVYTYLPLGWRVIQKISNIVREEMKAIDAQEILMPALVERKYLDKSGRWDVEIGYEVRGKKDKDANFTLGWTHEEVLAGIASKFISSYQDLPFYAYQIQNKFRNEPRAKSGVLRSREFIMKDLYSFHESEQDLFNYYERVKKAYEKVFSRCSLKTIYTTAGGGTFTISNTHEFQVEAAAGEDEVILCRLCNFAENKEISKYKAKQKCPKCQKGVLDKISAIEVGNIFPLGTKYSQAFNLKFRDKTGESKYVVMGSYGIGVSRLMGAIIEVHHDKDGIIWPKSVAPFEVHLLLIGEAKAALKNFANQVYISLIKANIDVLYDDRETVSAGEKFIDADLIGLPWRVVVSDKTLVQNKIEIKKRDQKETKLLKLDEFLKLIKNNQK